MPQRWSRPGLDGGLAGARAGRAARNGARARASHGEGGVEGQYSKEQGGRVSKMAVDRALSRGHAGHGRREGVSAALCPARMRNACGTWARSAICMRLVLRRSSVFSVLAGERVACRVRQFYPRSRSSILSYNDRGGIRFDRYRAPSVAQPPSSGRRAREGATASDTPGPGISQVM